MFTQRLSMDCTKEQYEKYLKDELLKMGYKEYSINCWNDKSFHYISNNYFGYLGELGTIRTDSIDIHGRTYLGSFNAHLFLALAAMTDKAEGNYGEYVIGKYTGDFYMVNDIFRRYINIFNVRKATKEEIMDKFGTPENKSDIGPNTSCYTFADASKYFITASPNYRINDNIIDETNKAISLLKSKGYKILKPKTWEEV